VHVPGPLSDDFLYTERVEIERAGCRVQRFGAQQQQPTASINRPPLTLLLLLLDAAAAICPHTQYVALLKFVTSYDVREQMSRQTNKLRL